MAIRVFLIDDSLVFRTILQKGIGSDPGIEIVGTAADPYEASEKIPLYKPDVVTCDIEMPRMNGIEFVKRLMPQYPLPVIVVSSVSDKVFDAMEAGAVDFVKKPDIHSPDGVKHFIFDLRQKIKGASKANLEKLNTSKKIVEEAKKIVKVHDLIAIGASTGGTEAIYRLLKQLPIGLPGIVVVQHIPPIFSTMFAERLNKQTHFTVAEGKTGDIVEKNHVYLAPGDAHMQVKKNKDGNYFLKVFKGERVNGHCPSVDVLFNSVAESAGKRAFGVILTGMGYDGAKGLAAMRRKGAMTLGQDEASCVVYGMPKAAFELNGVVKQVSLERMGHFMMEHLE